MMSSSVSLAIALGFFSSAARWGSLMSDPVTLATQAVLREAVAEGFLRERATADHVPACGACALAIGSVDMAKLGSTVMMQWAAVVGTGVIWWMTP